MADISKLTGSEILDIVVSSSSILGLADKSSSDTTYRATALKWLNLVMGDIANRQQTFHWRWLEKTATFDTVVDQMSYDLPSDIDGYKIFDVRQKTDDVKLKYVEQNVFDTFVPDPDTDSGNPTIYTLWADAIKLWPIPSSAITMHMRYLKQITALADDSATTEIPAKFNSVLIDGAMVYVYKFDPDLGKWDTQQQIYEAGIDKMIRDNAITIDDLPRPISHRTRFGGRDLTYGNKSLLFPLRDFS